MAETIAEALGVTNAGSNPFEDNECGGPPPLKQMLALDPIESDKSRREEEPSFKTDQWSDYEYSRRVAQTNLEQAQIVLQSCVEFVNSSPSARNFEVLGNMVKIVNDCTEALLNIQKKLKDITKPLPTPKGTALAVPAGPDNNGDTNIENVNVLVGNPTDALKYLESLRKKGKVIEAKVMEDGS